jgi:hypothetical protein
VRVPGVVALIAFVLTGCGAVAASAPRAEPPRAAPGAAFPALRRATWPGGPERCFDATDDNGNGIIDEGCGTPTGIVHVAIAWDAPLSDVDLLVTDPKGDLVEVGRPSAAGLQKDRDCPGKQGECQGRNLENVYLEDESREPRRGTYRVRVKLERLGGEDLPIRVTYGARLGPRTYQGELLLEEPEAEKSFDLVL